MLPLKGLRTAGARHPERETDLSLGFGFGLAAGAGGGALGFFFIDFFFLSFFFFGSGSFFTAEAGAFCLRQALKDPRFPMCLLSILFAVSKRAYIVLSIKNSCTRLIGNRGSFHSFCMVLMPDGAIIWRDDCTRTARILESICSPGGCQCTSIVTAAWERAPPGFSERT